MQIKFCRYIVNKRYAVSIKYSYREKAKEVSIALQNRPRTALQTAADWVEYVLTSDGAKHLRVQQYNLNFIQYFLIDVFAVLSLTIYAVFKLLQVCWRKYCCNRHAKAKAD